MSVLNSWQRIDRVLSGKPFGDGVNGDATISSDPNTRQSCSGAADQKNLTIASAGFSNGDLVMIHQSRGTGVGQWEINMVSSGGGTTTLVMKENLKYTYTDSGASQAQIIKIPRYKTLTINGFSTTAWNQNIGGISVIVAKKITVSAALNADGAGYRGGPGQGGPGGAAYRGEGINADIAIGTSANATAGGGGDATTSSGSLASGGGGGHASAGTIGTGQNATQGAGGGTSGVSDLTSILFGGAGGGSSQDGNGPPATGGKSGGIVILIARKIILSSNVYSRGQTGVGGANTGGGGGGSGGSILFVCETATLGTNKAIATGAEGSAPTNPSWKGGTGGTGRIAVHHSGTVTGTSNPAFTDIEDPTLVEPRGGNAIFFGTNF